MSAVMSAGPHANCSACAMSASSSVTLAPPSSSSLFDLTTNSLHAKHGYCQAAHSVHVHNASACAVGAVLC